MQVWKYASMLELCTVQSKGQIVCMFDLRHFPLDASIYHYPSLAVCQARMLSGRYRTCWLERHWCATNPPGNCSLPTCSLTPTPAQDNPTIQPILTQYSTTTDTALFVQFLLDCTVLPEVIVQSQIEGKKCRKADMHQHRWIVVHRFKQNNKVLNWKLYHILYDSVSVLGSHQWTIFSISDMLNFPFFLLSKYLLIYLDEESRIFLQK